MSDNDLTPTPRIPKIKSLTDVLRSMNRLHREAKQGKVSTQDMGRWVNLYQAFSSMIKDKSIDELAERLEQLENK